MGKWFSPAIVDIDRLSPSWGDGGGRGTVEGRAGKRKPAFFELPVMQQAFDRVSQQLFETAVIPVL